MPSSVDENSIAPATELELEIDRLRAADEELQKTIGLTIRNIAEARKALDKTRLLLARQCELLLIEEAESLDDDTTGAD